MFEKSKPRPAGKFRIVKKKKAEASRPEGRKSAAEASASGRKRGPSADARGPRKTKAAGNKPARAGKPQDERRPRASASRGHSVEAVSSRKPAPLGRKPAQLLRKPTTRPAVNLGIGPIEIAPPKDQPPSTGLLAAQAALDKKASDVVVLDVRGVSGLCDEMVVASARSVTHLGAVCDAVEDALRLKGERLLHSDGRRGAEPDWILLDYGDLMVHIFRAETREHTKLEDYYASAKLIAKWAGGED